MSRRPISRAQVEIYWDERKHGKSIAESSNRAGFSKSKANQLEGDRRSKLPQDVQGRLGAPDALIRSELGPEALRAMDDFGPSSGGTSGRIPYPWQVTAAETVVELLASPDKEYLVVNCPPGSWQVHTLFAHDIPAWLTSPGPKEDPRHDRLGDDEPGHGLRRPPPENPRRGRSRSRTPMTTWRGDWPLDAEATLADDFGRFQAVGDIWTRDSFVVQQYEYMGLISDKEPTWSGYGTGRRLHRPAVQLRHLGRPGGPQEAADHRGPKKSLQDYWDDVSEPRLEPGGLLVLQGQRFASDDLYRYCLDKSVGEEFDEDTGEVLDQRPMYHHILFKAHYEEQCDPEVTHKRNASPYPLGCLLSPQRLPWRELSSKMRNRADRFGGRLPATRRRPLDCPWSPRPGSTWQGTGSRAVRTSTGTDWSSRRAPTALPPSVGIWSQ